jgi:hypothetical protein
MSDYHAPPAPDPLTALLDHADALTGALATWSGRDQASADPAARCAANDAIDAIDSMLATLHRLRAALTADIRAADDATARRVDALLAARRQEARP